MSGWALTYFIDKGECIMKPEQIEAIEHFSKKGKDYGKLWDRILESAFFIHGHLCGGMPLGFRAGLAALKKMDVERELNMAMLVFVETGTGHAAGCFADGVQLVTGCTYGKGLIERTEYGKWALNLVEQSTRRAVRVAVRTEVMQASYNTPFINMRRKGVAPTDVPLDITKGLVDGLLATPDEKLFVVSDIFEYPLPAAAPSSFNLAVCADCGEAVAENKLRLKDGKLMCIPCAGYGE
jgi:formylmethanofuran dehydrogenase subunit E